MTHHLVPPLDVVHERQAEIRRQVARTGERRAASARRTRRRSLRMAGMLTLTVAAAASLVDAAAGAPARETQVGRDVVPSYSCATATGKGTFVQSLSTEDRSKVPAAGVLTSYRITAGNQALPTVGFRLLTLGSDGRFTVVGSEPTTSVPSYGSTSRPVRIPVRGGELLGLYVAGAPGGSSCFAPTQAGGDFVMFTPSDAQTGVPFDAGIFTAGAVLAVSAELEPDADRDGYGDATQDGCTTDPTTHESCEGSAPQTTIGSAETRRHGKVLLRLRASETATFRCAVDSADFRPCGSTFRTRLRPGRHVITVAATDTHGNTDPTPAVQRIRIRG